MSFAVGDYKQDSYYGRGQGETTILPLDNDPIALRHQIWLATDDAYKAAGQALAEKQAALKQFSADPNPVDDFAKAPPVIAVEPTVTLKVDEAAWRKTLEDVTNLYKQYPDIQSVTASARFSAINEYLVNSEGTVTRSGKTTYSVQLNSSAQAADGMRLGRSPAYMVARIEELPSRETLHGRRQENARYRCRAAASADRRRRISRPGAVRRRRSRRHRGLADRTKRVRAKAAARETEPHDRRVCHQLQTRVLPNFLTLIDDPTMKDFQGKSVVGNYAVDSEGVKAQPVNVDRKRHAHKLSRRTPAHSRLSRLPTATAAPRRALFPARASACCW